MNNSLRKIKPAPPERDTFDVYTVEVWKITSLDWEQLPIPEFDQCHLTENLLVVMEIKRQHPEWKYRLVHTTVTIIELTLEDI